MGDNEQLRTIDRDKIGGPDCNCAIRDIIRCYFSEIHTTKYFFFGVFESTLWKINLLISIPNPHLPTWSQPKEEIEFYPMGGKLFYIKDLNKLHSIMFLRILNSMFTSIATIHELHGSSSLLVVMLYFVLCILALFKWGMFPADFSLRETIATLWIFLNHSFHFLILKIAVLLLSSWKS